MRREVSDWRARIGLLNPNPNVNLTCEWSSILPDGVTFNEAIMGLTVVTPETLLDMRNRAIAEAKKLSDANMDIISFSCTSGSFVGGPGYDESIIKELEDAVGVPATTSSTCVMTAMKDLGVKKMALIGPYSREIFDIEINFFKKNGIETSYSKCLEWCDIKDYMRLHEQPYFFYRMAKEAYQAAPDVDVIFITCLCSPALKIINILEQETGKPVISSCLCTLYGILKKLGIRETIEELGQLGRLLGGSS